MHLNAGPMKRLWNIVNESSVNVEHLKVFPKQNPPFFKGGLSFLEPGNGENDTHPFVKGRLGGIFYSGIFSQCGPNGT